MLMFLETCKDKTPYVLHFKQRKHNNLSLFIFGSNVFDETVSAFVESTKSLKVA